VGILRNHQGKGKEKVRKKKRRKNAVRAYTGSNSMKRRLEC
jgi:hypothetical protein